MCKFFSLVSDSKGNIYYFNWKQRQDINKGKIKYESADSHTSIADYYGFKGEKEDKLNKYEYNPFTKVFTVAQINTHNDSRDVEQFCNKLDFKKIVPVNFDKKIINPFKDSKTLKVTANDIKLVKEWAWVRFLVRASVGDSVRDSVGAYISSFVDIKYKHDFSPAIKLWEKGLVPSFDGKIWRLHGKDGKILKEIDLSMLGGGKNEN